MIKAAIREDHLRDYLDHAHDRGHDRLVGLHLAIMGMIMAMTIPLGPISLSLTLMMEEKRRRDGLHGHNPPTGSSHDLDHGRNRC